MKIIIDAMGGDFAPLAPIQGAYEASLEYTAEFILVGNQQLMESTAADNGIDLSAFRLVDAPSVIDMEDDPLCVVRTKSDSSMAEALRLLRDGEGDALISAGNTGALFTGATLIVRKVRGIARAAIGTVMPFLSPTLLLDTGANVAVTDEYMEQFAVMGSAYMKRMYDLEQPRVGLLNNGAEPCKGTELMQASYTRLSACPMIHFVGNVEGSGAPMGECDVLVADGFTGNIFCKTVEGVGHILMKRLKEVFTANPLTRLSAAGIRGQVMKMKKDFDPSEHGGSPILGISKPIIKAHGSSDALAIKNSVRQAIAYAESGVILDIAHASEEFAAARKKEQPLDGAKETEER